MIERKSGHIINGSTAAKVYQMEMYVAPQNTL
jgi:hypothetical protein